MSKHLPLIQKVFTYFPTPRFLEMPHAGIDISPRSIRFIELERTTQGLRLEDFGEQTLPTSLVAGVSLLSNQDLVFALKKIKRTNNLSFVAASIPEDKAYVFTMEIPCGNEHDIRTHIEFHLEENVPISLADAVYDYFSISINERMNTFFASVTVVPLAVVDEYIDLFTTCGMIPISFLIENHALTKSIIAKGDGRTTLVVNLGLQKTVLSVVSNEAVQFTSTVSIGSDDLTAAIMKEFNVDQAEAEKVRREKGFTHSKENERLFLSLINTASALKDEINHIYVYWDSYREKNKENSTVPPICRIVLAGRDASLAGFREYLAMSMKTDVELANVWTNIFSFNDSIPPIEYLESLNYGTAIGLALPKQSN